MWDSGRKFPCNNIARFICGWTLVRWKTFAVSGEEYCKIGYASMVDVRIRCRFAPQLWVFVPCLLHVFMNQHLKICSASTISTNENVGTDATILWNVPARITKPDIALVVIHSNSNLASCRFNKAV